MPNTCSVIGHSFDSAYLIAQPMRHPVYAPHFTSTVSGSDRETSSEPLRNFLSFVYQHKRTTTIYLRTSSNMCRRQVYTCATCSRDGPYDWVPPFCARYMTALSRSKNRGVNGNRVQEDILHYEVCAVDIVPERLPQSGPEGGRAQCSFCFTADQNKENTQPRHGAR
jgi:hypothetical protein